MKAYYTKKTNAADRIFRSVRQIALQIGGAAARDLVTVRLKREERRLAEFDRCLGVHLERDAGTSPLQFLHERLDLAHVEDVVADEETFISSEVKGILAVDPPAPTLSPRQREVLQALVKGFSNTEIADLLGISRTVAKEHVETLLAKLGAANRTELTAIATRKHLV